MAVAVSQRTPAMGVENLVIAIQPIWFREWLDGISEQFQFNVAVRQRHLLRSSIHAQVFLDAFFSRTHQRDSIAH
ncbi:hypothetical protein MUY21_14655 [Aliiroseovarius sp. S2029]|uniref:hypothetical protein n=1 Tax=Aliiroseovarius sp. S2029 TaxID=2936988 RepID=UPI0020BF3D5C|nr:hypothetical protein [Aliiroseovarius sp. S2029]MCK8485282.1 hypothetical protein [Aliiroseovarius sp. S2029]